VASESTKRHTWDTNGELFMDLDLQPSEFLVKKTFEGSGLQ